MLYARHTDGPARLGLVTGRKYAPRAATRNLIRRLAREIFRVRRAELEGWDMLLRLHSRFDRQAMPSAASLPLRTQCRDEIVTLVENAVKTIRRRSGEIPADAASVKAAVRRDTPRDEAGRDEAQPGPGSADGPADGAGEAG